MASSLTVPFRPSDIATGLVGYWKFNNDATDSSASGYNLTAVNTPTYTANGNYWKDEYCANLATASSQDFYIADQTPLRMTGGSFSAVAWVKFTANNNYFSIFTKGTQGTDGYWLGTTNDGKFNSSIANAQYVGSTSAFSAGKWHHLAYIYNTTANTMDFYLDGNLHQSQSATTEVNASTGNFRVGGRNDGYTLGGSIKDAAIFNVVLTPLQIKSLALGVDLSSYAYRPNSVSTQPTHWWKLNEVSGNRSDSVSTNPLTLTDNNTVLSSGGYVEGVGAKFVGANSEYLSVANDTSLVFGTGEFTISCLINHTANSANGTLLAKGYTSAGDIMLQYDATSAPALNLYLGTADVRITTGNMNQNTWYHFVLRRSGNDFKAFIDGVQSGSTYTANYNASGTSAFNIAGNGTYYSSILMQDFCVWKGYALSDAEIKSLACALPIQRQGIVSYWKMDEASGNAIDSIGTNTGVETSGTIASTTGKVGNARDFEDGDTEHFEVTNSDSIDIVSDMFLACWNKPETVGGAYFLVDKDWAGDGYGLYLGGGTGNQGFFYIANDYDGANKTLSAGTWYHFAGNYDGAVKALYIDAVVDGSGAFTTNPSDTTSNLRIGGRLNDTTYYDGLMDEMILAKRYFRPEEIKAVYLKGLNGKEATSTEVTPATTQAQIIWIT